MGIKCGASCASHWPFARTRLPSTMNKDDNDLSLPDIASEATLDSTPALATPETLPPPARKKPQDPNAPEGTKPHQPGRQNDLEQSKNQR